MKTCKHCGKQIEDTVRFCIFCGTKVEEIAPPAEQPPVDSTRNVRAPRAKKKVIIAAILAVVVLCGAIWLLHPFIGGLNTLGTNAEDSLATQLTAAIDGVESLEVWMSEAENRFNSYPLTKEEQHQYSSLREQGDALAPKDYASQIEYVEEWKQFEGTVVNRLTAEAEAFVLSLNEIDVTYATDSQKQVLSEFATEMENLISSGEFSSIPEHVAQWQNYAETAAEKKSGYDVQIMQCDFSEYPKVRLYLDVRNSADGQIPNDLTPEMFYVSEADAQDGEYLNCLVTNAVQLNENESLNINILADTSGSMMYDSMSSAKTIMNTFLKTVQFSAGDQVKLTPFNSTIKKSGSFTGDLSQLQTEIASYTASGETKLYDAIIYGVQEVSSQPGAKCVLAFTDGVDVGSYNSYSDVIDVVSQYAVPVFIVRIGDFSTSSEDSALEQIATASGGAFKNLSQFNSELSDFYAQIYRKLKQYYVVDFEVPETSSIMDLADFSLYVQNQELGGETTLNAQPANELFDSLLGNYLRSYISDMNSHTYNLLANYVDSATDSQDKTSIEWQMRKQVSGGFGDIEEETLMNYFVTDISLQDDGTVLLYAEENYDVIYYDTIGDLKTLNPTVAKKTVKYLQNHYGYDSVPSSLKVRVWVCINQSPKYILVKSSDGDWRFSKFAGNIVFGDIDVYDVEIN